MVRLSFVLSVRASFGRGFGDGHQGRPEFGGQRLGIRAVVQILYAMVDPGDLAGAVDTAGGAELIVRLADQQVALTGFPAVQRGDRARRNILPATQVTGKAR